jgi:hypothetical protein
MNFNNREELENYIKEGKSDLYIVFEADEWEIFSTKDNLYLGSIKIDLEGIEFLKNEKALNIYKRFRGDILQIIEIFKKDKEVLKLESYVENYKNKKIILEFLIKEVECEFLSPLNGTLNHYRIKNYKLLIKKQNWESIKIEDLKSYEIEHFINQIMYNFRKI